MLQASERPNIYCETLGPDQFGIIEKPLTLAERIYNKVWLRKIAILVVLALAWEIYGRWLDNPLLVPPFSAAVRALITDVANGIIPTRALSSIEVLLVGFAIGTVLAGLLTVFAISSKIGTDFLDTMTAMFNPLPAIARLPRRVDHRAHGRTQLQSERFAFRLPDPDSGGVSEHPGRTQDRLGVCLAY